MKENEPENIWQMKERDGSWQAATVLIVTGGLSEKGIRIENTHHSLRGTKSGNSCSAPSMTVESKFRSAEEKNQKFNNI